MTIVAVPIRHYPAHCPGTRRLLSALRERMAARAVGMVPKSMKVEANGEKLPAGESAILRAAAQHREGVTREQLTVLTGYKRSSRNAYLVRLRVRDYVRTEGALIAVLPASSTVPDDYVRFLHHVGEQSLPDEFIRIMKRLQQGDPRQMVFTHPRCMKEAGPCPSRFTNSQPSRAQIRAVTAQGRRPRRCPVGAIFV